MCMILLQQMHFVYLQLLLEFCWITIPTICTQAENI